MATFLKRLPLPSGGEARMTVPADRHRAFDQFVVPEMDMLFGVSFSMTHNRAEAEDLVQDTLLRAFQAIDRFDGRYPRAWLLTILRNTHVNRNRRRRPGLVRNPETFWAMRDVPSQEPGPEAIIVDGAFDAAVDSALSRLPEDQKVVIHLVDVDGLSYEEVACVLGVPKGTVMSRLHRGRKRIRQHLVASGDVVRAGIVRRTL